MNKFTLEIPKNTYPKEVLIYSIKYSLFVKSFDIDDTSIPEVFYFHIYTDIENYKDFYTHIMERIQFSYLRYEISQRTQTERELIIGRALYRSCIKIQEGK